jgi:hypothetical protein
MLLTGDRNYGLWAAALKTLNFPDVSRTLVRSCRPGVVAPCRLAHARRKVTEGAHCRCAVVQR